MQYRKQLSSFFTRLVAGCRLWRNQMGSFANRRKRKNTSSFTGIYSSPRSHINASLHPDNGPLVCSRIQRYQIHQDFRKTASNMQRVYGCVKILSAFPPKFQLWDNGLVAFLLGRLQTDNPLYVPAEQYTGRAYTLGEHES